MIDPIKNEDPHLFLGKAISTLRVKAHELIEIILFILAGLLT